nr:chorismate lyase [uncultured Undibacterium sp.]
MQSKGSSSSLAKWHTHINHVRALPPMVDWLSNRDSLTARLMAHSAQFRVQRLYQGRALCLQDEFAEIQLHRAKQVIEREVLLRCDEVPVVYAHTVLPLHANAQQWPLFASLGNRSLGTTLFSDPLVERGDLSFARLRPAHPLMRRIAKLALFEMTEPYLWARRSVFVRRGAKLLVTEVFLPAIRNLNANAEKKS